MLVCSVSSLYVCTLMRDADTKIYCASHQHHRQRLGQRDAPVFVSDADINNI